MSRRVPVAGALLRIPVLVLWILLFLVLYSFPHDMVPAEYQVDARFRLYLLEVFGVHRVESVLV
jgi:hypothetical protein